MRNLLNRQCLTRVSTHRLSLSVLWSGVLLLQWYSWWGDHLRSKSRLQSGRRGNQWLLCRLQRDDLLGCICLRSSPGLPIKNARISRYCGLIRTGRLGNLILL